LNHQAFLELCKRDFNYFIENLTIDGPSGPQRFGDFISKHQQHDFKALSPALMYLAGVTDKKPKYQRFWIQRSRGYSKTSDFAAAVIWLLCFCNRTLEGYCVAEDLKQAGLIRQQMIKIVQYNQWILDIIDIKKLEIENKKNGAILHIESSDEMSSFGWTADIIICDEMSHWTKQGFWASVFSTFTKREHAGSVLLIGCNAGSSYDWKFDVKKMAMESPLWFHSAPDGHAPWYSKEAIKEQRQGLPSAEFERLWLNRWQASLGEFVTVQEADKCINTNLVIRDKTEHDGWVYVASMDYAEKVDNTVGVVTHVYGEDEDIIYVDRMDVISPEAIGENVRLEWCEQWIRNVQRDFGGQFGKVIFVLDKYQLLYLIQKLQAENFAIESFDFGGGVGNWELAFILRQLILHQRVQWYEGCGKILDADGNVYREEDGRNDLCTELGDLIIKKTHTGKKWRIDHTDSGHDDRAFALGACCRYIVQNSGGFAGWNIVQPDSQGNFKLGA
jgi:hypothetical protein